MKIAQVGTFDLDNLGDLLFPWVTSRLLRSVLGDDIVYDCFSPTSSSDIYPDQVPCSAISTLDKFGDPNFYDVILIGGGDLLRDDDYSLYPIYGDNAPDLTFSHIVSPTKVPNARLALLGVGLPYNVSDDFALYLKNSFSRMSHASVRDSRSAAFLGPCLRRKIDIVPDFVHSIPNFLPAERCAGLVTEILKLEPFEYICFQGHGDVAGSASDAAKLLKRLEIELDKKIVLLEIGGCLGDTEYLTELSRITGYKLISRKNVPYLTLEQKVAVIACSNGFIGSSLHGNIISNAYGVHNVSYVGKYSNKITSYFEDGGHGLLFADFDELEAASHAVSLLFSSFTPRKLPMAAQKYTLIEDFVVAVLRPQSPRLVSECVFDDVIDSLYKVSHAKKSSREGIARQQLLSKDQALAAEKENAVAQISYRNKLLEELREMLDAERDNSFRQITYRDKLIKELEAMLAAEKENCVQQVAYRDALIEQLNAKIVAATHNDAGL